MKNAISKLDGTELNGRKLKIFEDSRRTGVSAATPTLQEPLLRVVLGAAPAPGAVPRSPSTLPPRRKHHKML
ncbi:hypothetical protein CRENBAI_008334 [Crenichthys baileyi]|uniref:Uncharacterized protein n=1 Tax=Crenichthys baileyi TaxID=28760 RepID=A0AAV9SFY7_9TELE